MNSSNIVTSQVLDESTGQPLQNAIIYTADENGNPTALARTDVLGGFSANFPDNVPNVIVTAPGYATKIIDVGDINGDDAVQMTPAVLSSPSQATTFINNTTLSAVPWYVWVAGVGIIVYVASKPKKKSIGDGGASYILPIGIVVAAYFILNKLGIFSETGSSQNNKTITSTIAAGTASSLQQLSQQGINPTLSAGQAAAIANNIFDAGIHHVSDTDSSGVATIFNQLTQCQNDADIYLVMQNFGTRQVANSSWSLCYLANISCDAIDMDSFVTGILNHANIPGLQLSDLNFQLQNSELGPTGITYQF